MTLNGGGFVDMPKGMAAVQRDLNRMKEWTNTNLKGIQGQRPSPWKEGLLIPLLSGIGLLGDQLSRKRPALGTSKQNINQQCVLAAKAANIILGHMEHS